MVRVPREVSWARVAELHRTTAERACPLDYAAYLREGEEHPPTLEQVRLDLPRTQLRSWVEAGEERETMRAVVGRIVLAASGRARKVFPERIPYLQGMTWIAGPCVHVLVDEEAAFWLFCYVVEAALSPHVFALQPPLCGHRVDAALLFELLKTNPGVQGIVNRIGIEEVEEAASLLATRWLLTAFVDALHPTSLLTLWDQLILPAERPPVGALPSTPLFVWAVTMLSTVQASVLAGLGRRGGGTDPDAPPAVRMATLAVAATRRLPPGFEVRWMEVPGWDAASLSRRHTKLRAELSPPVRRQKSGGLAGLRHVWKSARRSAKNTDADCGQEEMKENGPKHRALVLGEGECGVVKKLLVPINAPETQRQDSTALCSFDLGKFLSTEAAEAPPPPPLPAFGAQSSQGSSSAAPGPVGFDLAEMFSSTNEGKRHSGGMLRRAAGPAAAATEHADPFASLWQKDSGL
eukprot:Hpha_TRINITY_DN10803_c0_g1::TRINITY_DN10803_c0_g1_i2::g.23133::m.23133/K19953/GRTP1, TBC1D6, MSB3_4; TBC1 domain family member 6